MLGFEPCLSRTKGLWKPLWTPRYNFFVYSEIIHSYAYNPRVGWGIVMYGGWSGEIRVVGGRVATSDVNINLYSNTDEAVAVAGLRRPSCSDRLATRTTKLLDLDMTALPLLYRGTVHNVLHYLRDNQTLRWEGSGFMLFMDTPTRRTRRQNSPSSLWPWTTRESPGTYTRAVSHFTLVWGFKSYSCLSAHKIFGC